MAGKRLKNNLKQIVPRGFLESYILSLLIESPLHGYEIMNKIKEKTKFWKPSPGTVYPALHSLMKRGLVRVIQEGRRKKYILTKKGLKIAREVKDFKIVIREKMIAILREVLEIDKKELERFFRDAEKRRNNLLNFYVQKMFTVLFKISENPVKSLKAVEILKEANEKLRKIEKMKV